jgi:hypothetical protein
LINKKEKDVGGKKVEVKVPDGYELIQDGLQIKFVEQSAASSSSSTSFNAFS